MSKSFYHQNSKDPTIFYIDFNWPNYYFHQKETNNNYTPFSSKEPPPSPSIHPKPPQSQASSMEHISLSIKIDVSMSAQKSLPPFSASSSSSSCSNSTATPSSSSNDELKELEEEVVEGSLSNLAAAIAAA